MAAEARHTRISRMLSRFLRHEPHAIGLTLEAGGWVPVSALLGGLRERGVNVTLEELREVVQWNDKQRFAFSEDGQRIRANQGHSVLVDLQLTPLDPPDVLYHGTSADKLSVILQAGLLAMKRHHVHLSVDEVTARTVGARHGRPVVLRVAAREMRNAGFSFLRSENGVWLVERVPPAFLTPAQV